MRRKNAKKAVVSRAKTSQKKHSISKRRPLAKRNKINPSEIFARRAVTISQRETAIVQAAADLSDLPFSYGDTKLVLLARDPYWAYSYWDFSAETWNWVQKKLAEDSSLKPMMRIHDLDAKKTYDLLVSLEARNWYLHLGTPDHRYFAELGIGDGHARFYLIARSNEVRTPRDSPSEVIDTEWNDRDFDEIYRLSGGGKPGLSSPGSIFIPRQL